MAKEPKSKADIERMISREANDPDIIIEIRPRGGVGWYLHSATGGSSEAVRRAHKIAAKLAAKYDLVD